MLRKAILDKSPELLQVFVDKALDENDVTAAIALLNKVMPNLKAENEPVQFNLDASTVSQATTVAVKFATLMEVAQRCPRI
ncbi:hypothetical protein, partial [Methyloprofundus sp.]|uniref:hypothetical protein n=1 Tax=Methyloprofundus sp. TaxID=2020875 RepID=UPI0026031D3A